MLVVGDLIADEFIYGEVRARVARGAGADPEVRRDGDGRRRRRQRGATTSRRSAAAPRSPGSSAPTPKAAGCSRASRAASIARRVVRVARVPDAGQDAHSRRRRPLGQAAGRPHRPRDRLAAGRRTSAARSRSSLVAGARRLRRRRAVRLRFRPGHAGARRRDSPGAGKRSRRRPGAGAARQRYRLLDYRGLTTCTPNESEVEQALGVRIDDNAEALERAGARCCGARGWSAVLITRGSRGMALFEPQAARPIHVPIFGSDEVADVTGAGDTVIATFGAGARGRRVVLRGGAAGQLRRRPRRHEARHRHRLGARTGRRRPTITTTPSLVAGQAAQGRRRMGTRAALNHELVDRRRRPIAPPGARSRSPTAASICCTSATCATCRAAAAEADRLIVAVNDDASVAALKGPGRPVLPAADRAELVARCAASTTSSSSATATVERLLRTYQARRPLQGHRLHRRHVPERAVVAGVRRPHGHRRRSETARHARPARAHPRRVRHADSHVSRFLIVRLGALGDIVHAIPVAAALRRAFPDAAHRLAGQREASRDPRPRAGDRPRGSSSTTAADAGGGLSLVAAMRRAPPDAATTSRSICRG